MPKSGSQCTLCDLPIHFDTYKGCSHGCQYCFAKKYKDISKIKINETVQSLKNFIQGKRDLTTKWCDWNIPIHWGGMSDPFQPVEATKRISYECLKLFAETKYPFIVSTKGKLIVRDDYLQLIGKCNCVVQISMICSKYDKLEQGCPSFDERLQMLEKVSKVAPRTIVRIQPYMHEVFQDVYNNLEKFKNAGAYGVIIEGLKMQKKKRGLVKVGGDFCYPYDIILKDFLKLKERAHELGLKIYAGENRIRKYGDSLTCCGCKGLGGFKVNEFNLNHILNGDKQEPTEKMKEIGTASCFKSFDMTGSGANRLYNTSFANEMIDYYKNKKEIIDIQMGVKH